MSKKFTPPQIAITREMIESGIVVLDAMTQCEGDGHTDDALVANIFFSMWETYWKQIGEVERKKTPTALIVPPKRSALILPMIQKR